ncbi:MAG: 50S ribosomal protein L13 [Candidatus Aenigmatarchaeota archaeon]
MEEIVIDSANAVVGRLASSAAKELLRGKRVHLVNAEQAVISGRPKFLEEFFKARLDRGDPYHGPFYPKRPDQMLKRVVRGMVSYKKPKGREAFKRLRVHISIPEELKGKELAKIKQAENRLECRHTSLGDLAVKLGAKKVW